MSRSSERSEEEILRSLCSLRMTESEGLRMTKMAEMACFSAKVYGRVQGVFFRYFVKNVAKNLGLKGYVRNLSSGDAVEVQAEGDKQQLEKLIEQLKIGPRGAWIKRVEVDWSGYSGEFTDFSIRY